MPASRGTIAEREEMRQDVPGLQAVETTEGGVVSAEHFFLHPVSRAVSDVKNQGPELIEAIERL